MATSADDYLLHIEMRVGKERASLRYSDFSIETGGTGYNLRVEWNSDESTVPSGLTLFPDLTPGCKSIFEAPYDPVNSCHNASPFGEYGSTVPGAGIHWGPWLGFGVSLDFIEFRFRKRECNNVHPVQGHCSNCVGGFKLRIDEFTGWQTCNAISPNLKCNNQLMVFPSHSCINIADCDYDNRQAVHVQTCAACDASCPTRCKGPLPSDCLFETCQ